ncbi:ATP-binding protein [Ruminococcus sp.]|uniref:HAMP domain-containing sensor histidine kinase n=1 Tax=Ruminococcus sp. TaxID=41978 RepID=UPI00388ED3A9
MKQKSNQAKQSSAAYQGKAPHFRLRRSLFQKYLIFGIVILLTSFIALSVTMFIFINRYWEAEKRTSLVDNAKRVADVIESSSTYLPAAHMLIIDKESPVGLTVVNMSEIIDADILIVDNKGKCAYCSAKDGVDYASKTLPSYVLAATTKGEFFEAGTLDGYFAETRYTAGVPIVASDDNGDTILAFCYASTPATFVSGLPVTFLQIFFIAAAVMLVIIIIFVASMSYSMSRPLRQMSSAAKKFAVGDFSVRVKVRSDDEIGELATAFNYMADSLSSSEGMRRAFISNVSHELKTPMTTIAGFIDGMLDGTIPPERQPHYMRIVSNEVKRLSRLVTSMLNLSRIDRGELKVNRQKFDLFSLLITILASYEQKIVSRKLHITGLEDFKSITVNADPDLMYQVIYNLIENAVKFTNEGGTIHFGVEETRYDISVMISNTGPGIPPEDIRFVFDRFYKTDKSRSIDKKGMGLGLFIAKTIMRLHGGDIYVESRVNEFTTFTVRLPRTEERPASTAASDSTNQYVETTANSETEE